MPVIDDNSHLMVHSVEMDVRVEDTRNDFRRIHSPSNKKRRNKSVSGTPTKIEVSSNEIQEIPLSSNSKKKRNKTTKNTNGNSPSKRRNEGKEFQPQVLVVSDSDNDIQEIEHPITSTSNPRRKRRHRP
jgi:hypothetical protein